MLLLRDIHKSGREISLICFLPSVAQKWSSCVFCVTCTTIVTHQLDAARTQNVSLTAPHPHLLSHIPISVNKQSCWFAVLCMSHICPHFPITISATLVKPPSCLVQMTANISVFSLSPDLSPPVYFHCSHSEGSLSCVSSCSGSHFSRIKSPASVSPFVVR